MISVSRSSKAGRPYAAPHRERAPRSVASPERDPQLVVETERS